MKFFSSCRKLYELSNEYFFVFFGYSVWEIFGLESTMVRIRVFSDVIVVSSDFKRMLGTKSGFFRLISFKRS